MLLCRVFAFVVGGLFFWVSNSDATSLWSSLWKKRKILWFRGGSEKKLFFVNNTSTTTMTSTTTSSSSSTTSSSSSSITDKKKLQFLDRIALISSSLLKRENLPAQEEEEEEEYDEELDSITHQSDLNRPGRHFHIVTTAALPWFTGTAVNPLLRAAHLHRRTQLINHQHDNINNENSNDSNNIKTKRWVTLVVPWLELPEDQLELYGQVFEQQAEQEEYIRNWLREDAGLPDVACSQTGLEILFYPARYHSGLRSIFAMGDIISLMEPLSQLDVCILEEPEHLNWYRAPGDNTWTKRFHYVVGIVHTNYKEYASSHYSGLWTAPAIAMMSSAMVRAYCHKVIKLSAVLQTYAPEKEMVSNVHGVRADFLEEGMRRAEDLVLAKKSHHERNQQPKIYFIGKLLWAKGLDILLDLEDYYKQCTGDYFEIDIFGNGPDQNDIMRAFHSRWKSLQSNVEAENGEDMVVETSLVDGEMESEDSEGDTNGEVSTREGLHVKAKRKLAKLKEELPKSFSELRRQPIPANFPGRVDHATIKEHDIFVNPSVSEVLCTTTAEALAMGKFAIIPVHPSNTFFLKFPNCLGYRNKFEFVANLRWAMMHDPEPLTPALARQFTWEAATDRLMEAAATTVREARERERYSKLEERIAYLHNELGKGASGDMLRRIFGAGPASDQVAYSKMVMGAEDEDDGLSKKFRKSSFAEAIRKTVGDLSLFIQ